MSLSTLAVMDMNLECGSPSTFHVPSFIEQSSADLHMLSTLVIENISDHIMELLSCNISNLFFNVVFIFVHVVLIDWM